MEKKLKISSTVALPLDAVTSTIVVYGGKGMGKTNFASVLVEEFDATGLRFAVIDPMGVWWGLRHDADGKGAGIEALILGGIHGDLPIEPTSGAIVADLVVDEEASVIIDISRRPDGSMWAIAERVRFVTDYAKRLYQRQGEKRRPIMQVIDEAARFAPQIVRAGDMDVAKCMGAIAVLVEEGRNVGIGVTLVTQRSARLNKDVAELADCMISFRIIGPNSMRAVLDWLGEHVDKARLKEIGEQLRSLPRGSALVVSPGWLEYEGIAAMRKRRTFDSSATPKPGHVVRASGTGAKPDLAKYRERLADVVERAKADDPKALKARVAELERELAKKPGAKVETKTVEKPVIKEAQLQRIGVLIEQGDRIAALLESAGEKAAAVFEIAHNKALQHGETLRKVVADLRAVVAPPTPSPQTGRSEIRHRPAASQVSGRAVVGGRPTQATQRVTAGETAHLPPGEAATLRALLQFPEGLQRTQLTVLTQYKRSSRDAYIQRLREKGLIEVSGDRVMATAAGAAAMPNAEPLPTGQALQEHWLRELPEGERAVLSVLLDAQGAEVTREEIDRLTGYQRSSRDAYLQRLKAKELVIPLARGLVKASPNLFEVR